MNIQTTKKLKNKTAFIIVQSGETEHLLTHAPYDINVNSPCQGSSYKLSSMGVFKTNAHTHTHIHTHTHTHTHSNTHTHTHTHTAAALYLLQTYI